MIWPKSCKRSFDHFSGAIALIKWFICVDFLQEEFSLQFSRIKSQNGYAGKEPSIRCCRTGMFHWLLQSQLLSKYFWWRDLCVQNRNQEAEWPRQPFCTEVACLKQVPVKNNWTQFILNCCSLALWNEVDDHSPFPISLTVCSAETTCTIETNWCPQQQYQQRGYN